MLISENSCAKKLIRFETHPYAKAICVLVPFFKQGQDMGKKQLFKTFIKYVSLSILGQIALSSYTLMDTFFVSVKLGADGLAALNIAFPIFCIINGLGLLIGMGGGVRYSIYKARSEQDKANQVFTASIIIAILLSIIFVLSGLFLSRYIVIFLGADESIIEMTNTYAKVMLLFTPAFFFNNLFQCFIRNDGKPSLSMTAMITGSLSNILLDYIFIFPLNMGIFGAILATGLAPIISLLVQSPYIICRKNNFHIAKMKINLSFSKEIFVSGFSPFLTEFSSGIVMFLFNFIILKISGNIGVSAFGIITVVSLVTIAIFTGLSQGVQPIMAKNYGEGKNDDVKCLLRYSLITSLLLSTAIYLFIFFGNSFIASIFNSEGNETLQSLAESGLRIYFIAVFFIGINIVLNTYFISIEKPIFAQIISLSRGFIILIPMAFLLSYLFNMTGVYASYPVTEAIVCIIGISLYLINVRNKEKLKTTL